MYFPLSGWEGKGPAWAEMFKEPIHQLRARSLYSFLWHIQQPFGPTGLDIYSPVQPAWTVYWFTRPIVKRPGAMHYCIQGVVTGGGSLAPKVHRGGLLPCKPYKVINHGIKH